ncbi:MAG: hypothetical protein WDO18_15990 [Acidobacteriota bacterium]
MVAISLQDSGVYCDHEVCCSLVFALVQRPAQPAVDAAFTKFWSADSPEAAQRASVDIERSGVSFDNALRRLKAGRTYRPATGGIVPGKNRTADGVEHFYSVNLPANYNPAKKYQVRFQLHGGVGGRTDNQPRGKGDIGNLAGAEQIYVLPYAWDTKPWWSDDQVMNLAAIVDSLKRSYNVDENRVVVAGVSDGATGAYYIAMRDTTPYANFLILNGYIMVLSNEEIDDGRVYPNNLRAKPFFVVNGGKDRLYPIRNVEPYTKYLMSSGVEIDYHPQPEGEHNTAWWPEIKGPFEAFVAAHPRDPYPDKLSWKASDIAHARSHWLVIDRFGSFRGESSFDDINFIPVSNAAVFDATSGKLFDEKRNAGRVDLARKGNTIEAQTQGVTNSRCSSHPISSISISP